MKIPNKQKLKQIACNHSSDIYFQGFMKTIFKTFLNIDATLAPDNALRVIKNILESK